MSATLKSYIRDLYRADPKKLIRFANESYRLVHVKKRWWRGYRIAKDVELTIENKAIERDTLTAPKWRLCPKTVRDEFSAFETSVTNVIKNYCFSGEDDGDLGNSLSVLLRGGTYAVPVSLWPRVNQMLRHIQEVWSQAADKWCTTEGHDEFKRLLKDQLGDNYEKAEKLIPDAGALRATFGLMVTELPVVISSTKNQGSADEDRACVVGEILEAAIRGPRADAKKVWTDAAELLVTVEGGEVAARALVRKSKTGGADSKYRTVRGVTVLNAREAAARIQVCAKAVDPRFKRAVDEVTAEFPDAADAAAEKAKVLNKDDVEAVRVGKMLLSSAVLAEDESSMCDALAAALS